MNNVFTRQKIKLALSLGVLGALVLGLFFSFKSGSPRADVITPPETTCASALPVVEIVDIKDDAYEEGQEPAKVMVRYTKEIKAGASQMQVEIALGGDATYGKDYTFTKGASFIGGDSRNPPRMVVIFTRGQPKEQEVVITPVDDADVEIHDPELLTMRTIPNSDIYSIGVNKSTEAYIYDNDIAKPVIRLVATDAAAAEEGRDPAVFTVSATKIVTRDVSVKLTINTSDVVGDAVEGTDYEAFPKVVTIKAGTKATDFPVKPIDDSVTEPTEYIGIELVSSVDNYAISSYQREAYASIEDNDGLPVVIITPAKVSMKAGESSTLTLTRTGNLSQALPVTLLPSGTAVFNTDYTVVATISTGGNPTIIIPTGKKSQTFTVRATGIIQGTKTARLSIAEAPTTYKIGNPGATDLTLTPAPTASLPGKIITTLFGVNLVKAATTGCIYGIVSESDTGRPLPNVRVKLDDGDDIVKFTQTDTNGYYEFSKLPKDKDYDITPLMGDEDKVRNIVPTAEVNLEVEIEGDGTLSGIVKERLANGSLRPIKAITTTAVAPVEDNLNEVDASQAYVIGADATFEFVYLNKKTAYQIAVAALGFKDLASKPHTPDKKDIVIIPERLTGKLSVKAIGRFPGENIDLVELPTPPRFPAVKFTLRVKPGDETNQVIGLDEAVFPARVLETTVPTLSLDVPAGTYEVIFNQEDNPGYKLFAGTESVIQVDVAEDETSPSPALFSVTRVETKTGTLVDRKLKGTEDIPGKDSCSGSGCGSIMRDIAAKLGLRNDYEMSVFTIPPRLGTGYDVTIEHEDQLPTPITGHTVLKSRPDRAEFQARVPAADGYIVTNKAKAALCVLVESRINNKTQKKYMRLNNVEISFSKSVNVPTDNQAEARWVTFPSVASTNADVSGATVENLGWQGPFGIRSKNLCMKQR